jgi:hypothetical protein
MIQLLTGAELAEIPEPDPDEPDRDICFLPAVFHLRRHCFALLAGRCTDGTWVGHESDGIARYWLGEHTAAVVNWTWEQAGAIIRRRDLLDLMIIREQELRGGGPPIPNDEVGFEQVPWGERGLLCLPTRRRSVL